METHHISAERLSIDRVAEILSNDIKLALSDVVNISIKRW